MAEITRRRVGELQRGVFNILLDHPDGLPASEVLDRLEKLVPPLTSRRVIIPTGLAGGPSFAQQMVGILFGSGTCTRLAP